MVINTNMHKTCARELYIVVGIFLNIIIFNFVINDKFFRH